MPAASGTVPAESGTVPAETGTAPADSCNMAGPTVPGPKETGGADESPTVQLSPDPAAEVVPKIAATSRSGEAPRSAP